MNLLCAFIILSFIAVNFKTSEAEIPNFEIVDILNTANTYNKIYKLGFPQPYYHNTFPRPLKPLINLLKHIQYVKEPDPFDDLTRGTQPINSRFSDDYIDLSELARENNQNLERYKFKPEQTKNILIDIHGNTYKVLKMLENLARRSNRKKPTSSDESSSDSDKRDSDESENDLKDNVRTKPNPKRFKVINNISGESDNYNADNLVYLDSVDSEAKDDYDEDILLKDEAPDTEDSDGSNNELMYVQSPTRHLKTSQVELRRRLQHFLPKRVHWSSRDFMDLNTYWINGPRGKYPAQYRTPY